MREKNTPEDYNFPPIRPLKKPSFDLPYSQSRESHDLTPLRKRNSTKPMTLTSMPLLAFDDHCYKVFIE